MIRSVISTSLVNELKGYFDGKSFSGGGWGAD